MDKALKTFERFVVVGLIAMMTLAILVSSVELGIILFQELMKPPRFLLNIQEMQEVFGFFLMVLIGLELLESIKAYLKEGVVHAEVVLLVAIVAVSRKVIIMDYKDLVPQAVLSISAVIVALGLSYYLVRRALHLHGRTRSSSEKLRSAETSSSPPA